MNNRFEPPQSEVSDIPNGSSVSLSRPGLIRLYHRLVLTSIGLGVILATLSFSQLPLSEELSQASQAGTLGALVSPSLLQTLWWLSQPLWLVAGIGLYFFRSWARWLFVCMYAYSNLTALIGGAYVQLPWEIPIHNALTLVDGALFVLIFLPPLNEVFRDGSA